MRRKLTHLRDENRLNFALVDRDESDRAARSDRETEQDVALAELRTEKGELAAIDCAPTAARGYLWGLPPDRSSDFRGAFAGGAVDALFAGRRGVSSVALNSKNDGEVGLPARPCALFAVVNVQLGRRTFFITETLAACHR